jgi:dTDP-4-dehydrorhamnose 3,5-epimerase
MIFTPTVLQGSYVIEVDPFSDERGWFARFYSKDEFSRIGHDKEWVQLNHSVTKQKGALRGMHFQKRPFREVKMIKCVAGKIFDVIIDLRENSTTFLQWIGIELSAENKKMLYIPEGFAHGFQCLEDNCELIYHHSESYSPGAEGGIRYNDPKIGIHWPVEVTLISGRDAGHPYLNNDFKGI